MVRTGGLLAVSVLSGAIVGVGVGWMAWGDAVALPTVTRSGQVADARASHSGREPEAAMAAPASVAPERAALAVDVGTAAPASVLDDAVAFARQAPPPASSRGTKTIRGRIVDRAARPVAGAAVRATHESEHGRIHGRSGFGEAAPPPARLEEAVKRAVEAYYDRAADRRETMTDADGDYAFTDLRDGRWTVQAWQPGFSLTAHPATAVRPDATVDFAAVPVVLCGIDVELPDGSQPTAASIAIRRVGAEAWDQLEPWSRERPRIALCAGEWELRATLGDPDNGPAWPDYLASTPAKVVAEPGQTAPVVALRLKGARGVRGTIIDRGGGRRHTMVKLQALARGAEPDLGSLARNDDHHRWASDGSYAFKDLEPGRYAVGVSGGWNERIVAHAAVEVGDGMVVQDLEIPPLDVAKCAAARVVDPRGRLLEDVAFSLNVDLGNMSASGGVDAERRADGSWLIPLEDMVDGLFQDDGSFAPDAAVTITASADGFGDASVKLATGGSRELEIRFGEPATLVATVGGYIGSGYEARLGLALRVVEEGEEESHRFFGGADAVPLDGSSRFGPVAPGRYRLLLSLQDCDAKYERDHPISLLDLTLSAGENRVTLAIPTLHSLTVLVPDGVTGSVDLDPATEEEDDDWRSGHQVEIDAQGRAHFESVVAGKYRVSLWSNDLELLGESEDGPGICGWMEVEVPAATGAVRFKQAVLNALVVWIEDESGALAEAGFEAYDIIVAVGGERFEAAAAMKAAIATRLAQKSIDLTVWRAGEERQLTVETRVFTNPFELGGAFHDVNH